MEKIETFFGKYRFLSNFYPARVEYKGIVYNNSEAAFQAAKCADEKDRLKFAGLTAAEAKKLGCRVKLRPGWESDKRGIMKEIVLAKFAQNPHLKEKLLATGDAALEEGNTWGDTTWGLVGGKGENALGKILMQVRDELRN